MSTHIDSRPAAYRLLQLASPTLPVGAYSYSQGMEWAVEDGWLTNEASVKNWLVDLITRCLVPLDGAVIARLHDAWISNNQSRLLEWNDFLIASRETKELRNEDVQMGKALLKLLGDLDIGWPPESQQPDTPAFALAFSKAAVAWEIPRCDTIGGYFWSWLENQVLAAIKLVPLGQLAGQRILSDMAILLPDMVEKAQDISDTEVGGTSPALAIASSRHETQYSRLFRS